MLNNNRINNMLSKYTSQQIELLKQHLHNRFSSRKYKKECSIVFDILHRCDLACKGCGTNARCVSATVVRDPKPSLKEIETVFEKIKQYSIEKQVGVFVNIGGGEPFLRYDILDVIKLASEYFTPEGVGIDTNGSLPQSLDLITEAMQYLSYVGISINGLHDYHNWWAGNNRLDAFNKATSVIKEICKEKEYAKKLEITSVATKKNINEIPQLMSFLCGIGVKNYSVHRAIPVGRMANIMDLIPNAEEYLDLLVLMIDEAQHHNMNVHLHHSIESIYATLLLGYNTYEPDKIGNPDAGSSIGIEPNGYVVFDPWCTTGMWKSLTSGIIMSNDVKLYDLIEIDHGSILDLAKMYTAPHLRCEGCSMCCSGGSRIAAAAEKLKSINQSEITDTHILDAMTAVDPACPFFVEV